MKKLSKLLNTILGGALFCIVLASCDNFMTGGNIRKEIEEVMAYNNALECDVLFRMDSGNMGEILGTETRTMREGYDTEIQFEIYTTDYVFVELQAVSQDNKDESRADFVKIQELSRDDTKGKYKYKVTLLKQAKDILIRPVCKEKPKLGEIIPAVSSQNWPQDTSIEINFSKPVKKESFGDFSCISIYADDDLKDQYFSTPILSEDGKTLYIHTKQDEHILAPDGTKKLETIHISYDFTNVVDAEGLKLTAKGSHEYKINRNFTGEQTVAVWIPSDTADFGNCGRFTTPGGKECTVKYTVDFQFNLNKSDYVFLGFNAISNDTHESLNQFVTINEIDYNDETGVYKANIRVNKECDDILIIPEYKKLPAVTGHEPNNMNEQSSNTPIVINFNMPMEEADAVQSLFTKENISLVYKDSAGNNTDMRDYFENPVFDSTKQTLTIVPKIFADPAQKDIEQFILRDKKVPYADINVSFSENIVVNELDRQGNKLALKQDSKSRFAVRYKADIEQIAPAKVDFFVSASEITFEKAATFAANKKFTEEALSEIENNNDKILQNRTKGKIWIYGKYYDKDSGVKTVYVTEKRTNDVSGDEVSEQAQTTPYTVLNSNGASFKTDKDGNTEFVIPYSITAEDGAITIAVVVEDACGNFDENESQSLTAIKDSYVDLSELNIENTPENLTSIWFTQTGHPYINDNSESNRWTNLKKVVYGSCVIPETSLKVECLYTDDSGVTHAEDFLYEPVYSFVWTVDINTSGSYTDKKWSLDLKNIANVSGKTFTVRVTDDIGNISTKDFTFPPLPVLLSVEEGYSNGYPNINFSHEIMATKNDSDNYHLILFAAEEFPNKKIGEKYTYANEPRLTWVPEGKKFYVKNTFSKQQDSYGLYGESSPVFESTITASSLDPVEVTDITYAKSSRPEYTDVTVHIAADSWEKYDSIYMNYTSDVFFERGELSCTTQIYTARLFGEVWDIKVMAEKQGGSVPVNTIHTVDFSSNQSYNKYDNISPSFGYLGGTYNFDYLPATRTHFGTSVDLNDYLMFTNTLSDIGTGLSHFTVKNLDTGGEQTFRLEGIYYDPTNKYVFFPKWDLEKDSDFILYAYDNNGNVAEQLPTRNPIIGELPEITEFNGNIITTAPSSKDYYLWYCYTYEYNDSDSDGVYSWEQKQNKKVISTYTTRLNRSYLGVSMATGHFYKVIYQVQGNSGTAFTYDNSVPRYYYYGSQNTGDYDLILANGSSKDSVAISSDAPVFVQTLTTKYTYEECKTWSRQKWQRNRRHIGEKVIQFDADNHAAKRYNIPINEIDSGDCYCVIAHFADGSTAMSEVMQKP